MAESADHSIFARNCGTLSRRAILGAACVAPTMAIARHLPRSSRPNILVIVADDLGYADLSCYGARDIHTPSIDAIAARGLRLTQGYSNSPVCSATRTALATGMYQYRFPIGLEEPVGDEQFELRLPIDRATFAIPFKEAGYRTGLVGKWHLGPSDAASPTRYGYEHYFGFRHGGVDYFRHRLRLKGDRTPGDGLYFGEEPVEREGYLTDLLGAEAVRWVALDPQRPFLLNLHFNAPHWPWQTEADSGVAGQLESIHHTDGGSRTIYARMVERMDLAVGMVLKELERSGRLDETLILFTSDNGGERFSDMWPFTGMKGELLEGGIRVPIILSWPAGLKGARDSDQVMLSMDVLPTLMGAAGIAARNADFDGLDLWPMMVSGESRRRQAFWRYKNAGQAAVRDGDWKYLAIGGREFLFDLAADQRERADLKDRNPQKFGELKRRFEVWNRDMLPYPPNSRSAATRTFVPDRY